MSLLSNWKEVLEVVDHHPGGGFFDDDHLGLDRGIACGGT